MNENLFIKIFNNLNDSYFNLRNKTYLRFPFDIKFLSLLKKNVIENLRALSSKPYKLIILDCDNTLWGGILDEDCIDGIAYGEDGNGLIFYEFQNTFFKKINTPIHTITFFTINNFIIFYTHRRQFFV